MKYTYLILLALAISCGEATEKKTSEKEETATAMNDISTESWKSLFDGNDFSAWKGYLQDSVPEAWKIEDGAMVFYPPESRPEGESYNIITRDSFQSFVLELEWRISPGGNSGVFWGIEENNKFGQPYETGPEIQILDNQAHPDAKNGPVRQAGALYDMAAPEKDVTNPAGEWNQMTLTVDYEEQRGTVVMNGEEIVDFPLANELWDVMVSKSKFANWPGFAKRIGGHIGLQDHGDKVSYRNIRIKEL